MQVSEVVEVIKRVPDKFLATVRPLTSISKNRPVDTGSVLYSEIRPVSPSSLSSAAGKHPLHIPEILVSGEFPSAATPALDSSPTPSLEDVGFYDDEEDGDTPPPLPPRTEDALVILDPPPQTEREKVRERDSDFKPALPPRPLASGSPPLSLHPSPRPPFHKSRSEEIIAGNHSYEEVSIKKSPRPRRHHDYEEIQPMLNYMDIGKLDFSKREAVSKADSLVKVEMDLKHKLHV